MPHDVNRNARWARLIAEELHRGGVHWCVLCPGSRNSPLLFALAQHFGEQAIVHIDERSAGFIAVGLIRATGERAAVCVTSGSAVANVLPAICEADAAHLPLMIISADRPWEAHDCGAPQTMPQRGIFTSFVRAECALGEPADDEASLRALRTRVSRVAQINDGPTHLNVPLRDPLPPLPDATWQPPQVSAEALTGRAGPFVAVHRAHGLATLRHEVWMRPGLKGLIVVGCQSDPSVSRSGIQELARATGFPVFTDAPSHLRRHDTPHLITTADALVSGALADAVPEVIIQFGPTPLVRSTFTWLSRLPEVPWVSFGTSAAQDSLARSSIAIADPRAWQAGCAQLATWLADGDPQWTARWEAADTAARSCLASELSAAIWSESSAVATVLTHAGFAFVQLASSMAVRHANLLAGPSNRPIHSNRGVNGIDGTLGTFIGASRGHEAPGVLLIGDLAFLHDLPALAASHEARGGAIVILNNGGGAIFDYLPVSQVPEYQRLVRTSHAMTFSAAAEQFGLPYHPCRTLAELREALAEAASSSRMQVVECLLQGLDAVAVHRGLIAAINSFPGNAGRTSS